MKTMMRALLLAFVLFAAQNYTEAQTRIGYIYGDSLLKELPEYDSVVTKVNNLSEKYSRQLETMQADLRAKYADYERRKKDPDVTKLFLEVAEGELNDLQTRIQTFGQNAQKELAQYESDLVTPLVEKVKTACADVSKEMKYDYVIDAAPGLFWHMSEKDNLMNAVRKKLGISAK